MAGIDGLAGAGTRGSRRGAAIWDAVRERPLVFLIAFAVLVRLVFFVGLQLADDLFYIKYAFDLTHGNLHLPTNHWETRIGLVFPVALVVTVFGFNEYALALFPLACSVLNVFLTYRIAARLFSPRTALLSAFLLSVFPLEIYFGTSVYPTVPLATLGAASVYLMVLGLEDGRPRRLLLSGFLLGAAYLVHPTGLYLALPMTIWVAFSCRGAGGLRKAAVIVLGLSLVVLAEMGTYQVVAGNALLGVGNVVKSFDQTPTIGDEKQQAGAGRAESYLFKDRRSQIQRGSSFLAEPLLTLTTQQEFGLFYFMIIPAVVWFSLKKEKSPGTVLMLLWFLTVALYLFYGSVSPFQYRPLRRWPRYFSPVTVPGVILLAAALDALLEKRRQVVAAGAVLVLAVSSLSILTIDNWHRYAAAQRLAASFMRSTGGLYLADKCYWSLAPFLAYDPAILRRYDPQEVGAHAGGDVYLVRPGDLPGGDVYPEVAAFATPKTLSVRMAEAAKMPQTIVRKLWRKETLRISRIR